MPSKDSLARSTQDVGLYSVQNSPKRVPVGERVDKGLPSKESWQGVEKNVFDSLTEFGILQPDSTLMVAAQMGKSVVLLLFLPGQLLFFTLPKWVAFEVFPKFVEKLSETLQLVPIIIQKIVEPLAKSVAFVEKTFTQWKEHITERFTKVARAVKETMEPLRESAKELVKSVYQTLTRPVKAAAAVAKRGVEATGRLSEKVAERVQVVSGRVVEGGERLLKAAALPIKTVYKQLAKQLAKQVKFISKGVLAIQERIEGAVQMIKGAAQPIAKAVKKLFSFGKQLKIPFPKKIPIPLALFKKAAQKIKVIISRLLERDFVPEILKNVMFSALAHNIWINIMTPFLAEGILGKQLVHFVSWVKSVAAKVAKLKESLFSMIQSGSHFLKQAAKKLFTYGMKGAKFAWEKGKVVLSWVMVAARLVFRLLKWLLYCFRVVFAVIKVITILLSRHLARGKPVA